MLCLRGKFCVEVCDGVSQVTLFANFDQILCREKRERGKEGLKMAGEQKGFVCVCVCVCATYLYGPLKDAGYDTVVE